MPGVGVALEQTERVIDRVDQRPVEGEQLLADATREDDLGHASAGGPTLGEFAAQIVEGDCFLSRELGQPNFDRANGRGI